ncbi:MAG: hypothetical protein HY702_02910 [Gemmatimonadetes bacterium]|nr:hypothetical protein [Gemmatimonadota bacterium]
MRRALVSLTFRLLVGTAFSGPVSAAQEPFDFYARAPYRPQVPRPSRILGYEPGEFHTGYGDLLRVTDELAAAASDRLRIVPYGRSVEGRPLRLLVISAPENLARLEEIRSAVERLSDPRLSTPDEARAIARTTPVIAWLNYANDGNESAAFEAAMQVAYELAASEHAEVLEILRDVVTIVNAAHNPESHERFVAWYNAQGIGDSAHIALEHNAFWSISTNNNHYQIDLNRDFLGITQRETRAIVAALLHWNPQVVVDHHGETKQFFFPPTALPMVPSLPWDQMRKWETVFGRANAQAFDRYGWQYYVRDIFDFFYPGYADTWPSLNGATGMTYETDGGGDRGYRWRREDGTVVTLRDGIARHFTASLATLSAAAAHREERLGDFYGFRGSAMADARRKPYQRFVILPGSDPERAARLVEVLLRARVEVRLADRPFRSERAHGYLDARRVPREFPAGAYVVDLAQPQARLVETVLAPDLAIDSLFLREQLARRARNARRGGKAAKERYEFYDVTAWSLPLSFGVDAYWTEDAPPASGRLLDVTFNPADEGWQPPWRLGARRAADLPAVLADRVDGGASGRAASAYAFTYERDASARLAIALLQEGYKVAVATRPIRAGGRSYPRGAWILRVDRNPDTVHERIAALARDFGVAVDAVATAFVDEGPSGVGSEHVISIRLPRIAVIAGDPVSETGYGHLWYTLSREFGLAFTPVNASQFGDLDLENYDVVIFPPGSANRYRSALREDGVARLKRWAESGGVVVGIAGGAEFLADPKVKLTSARVVGKEEEKEEDEKKEAQQDTVRYMPPPGPGPVPPLASPSGGETKPLDVPGAIFRAAVDRTHPLTFGYETDTLAVFLWGDEFFTPSKEGSNPVVFAGDRHAVAGFVWPENTEKFLKDTAYLIDEPIGKPNKGGRVILFADDPNFRLLWPSLGRLFVNAILFGPSVR